METYSVVFSKGRQLSCNSNHLEIYSDPLLGGDSYPVTKGLWLIGCFSALPVVLCNCYFAPFAREGFACPHSRVKLERRSAVIQVIQAVAWEEEDRLPFRCFLCGTPPSICCWYSQILPIHSLPLYSCASLLHSEKFTPFHLPAKLLLWCSASFIQTFPAFPPLGLAATICLCLGIPEKHLLSHQLKGIWSCSCCFLLCCCCWAAHKPDYTVTWT